MCISSATLSQNFVKMSECVWWPINCIVPLGGEMSREHSQDSAVFSEGRPSVPRSYHTPVRMGMETWEIGVE